MKSYFPNYKDGSILNLSSSIERALGGKPKYGPLKLLPSKSLTSKNIVLIMVDALGYNYLTKYGKSTFMYKHLKGKITSAFPSTSPASSPSFQTGQSASEHGMVGHAIYIEELGGQVRALSHRPRKGYDFLMKPMKEVYGFKPIADRIGADSYAVLDKSVVDSEFVKTLAGTATRVGQESVTNMFEKIGDIIKSDDKKKFIFALYWEHDHLAHDYRTKSKKVLDNLKQFDKLLQSFVNSIKGTDTTMIVCADHGMIDIPDKKMIFVEDHPKLKECLKFTTAGQQRYLYCYVKKDKRKQFENYIKTKWKHCCMIFTPEEIIKKKYFGWHKPYKDFKNRLGDYVLIPKDDYAIYDLTPGEDRVSYGINFADHGGFSSDEIFVPLIVIRV